ncbi:MAG: Protein kinase protein, partial [Gammaproteobacteria bacterium]|nr:Protein kinase protein [Gammaproteobacteria bacterium]
MNDQSPLIALEPGYVLHWYRMERVLGQGAFGITYLAHDVNLDRQVAIKEYLPGQFSSRNSDLTVQPTTNEQKEDFEWGLKRFISEARTLTKFEHANLVRVFNVFEMNNTAYMVMNYEVGKSLQQILKSRKTLNESELKKILMPLMSGLELMHEKGFVHRDIKPGNIFIRSDGSPVLLDFGSARQTRATTVRDGGEGPQTLTTLVSPGFAPIEQYGSKSDRQGPWTDVYGLGATLYRAVTGLMPIAAVDRGEAIVHDMKDPYLPLTEVYKDRYSQKFLSAIDHAMAFKAQDRPQSIAEWRKEFGINENEIVTIPVPDILIDASEAPTAKPDQPVEATVKLPAEGAAKTEKLDSEAETLPLAPAKKLASLSGNRKLFIAGTAAVLILIGAFVFRDGNEKEPVSEVPTPEMQSQIPAPDQNEIPAAEVAVKEAPG